MPKADWMSESTKNLFEQSNNDRMKEVGEEQEEEEEAVWKEGKVFFGWKLGDSKELEQIIERFNRRPEVEYNEAVRKGIRQFCRLVKNRRANDNNKVWIDRAAPDVAFIAGERGSGKSFILRAMTDRSTVSGTKSVMLDVEHEYYTSNTYNGIQKSLMTLRHNEDRQNVDTKVLMPEFVYQAREDADMPEKGYEYMDRFKFGFEVLDSNAVSFLLQEKFGQHADFDSFTNRLATMIEEGTVESWQTIKDLAMDMQNEGEFTYTKRGTQIKNYIKNNYEQNEFLGADKKLNLEKVYQDYNRVALVLHAGGRVNEDLKMKELYTAFFIKKIRNLKERNKITGDFRFNVEEAHKLVPAHTKPGYPPSKEQIREVIKRDRKRGLSVTLASQEPTDIQEKNFLNQTRHYFLPQNLRPRPRKKMLKIADVWQSGDMQRGKWQKIFESMSKYQWMYINAETGEWYLVEPASPLSRHYTA